MLFAYASHRINITNEIRSRFFAKHFSFIYVYILYISTTVVPLPYDDKELYCIILFSRSLFRRLLVTTVTVSAYAIVVVVINNAHLFRQLIAAHPQIPFNRRRPIQCCFTRVSARPEIRRHRVTTLILFTSAAAVVPEKNCTPRRDGRVSDDDETTFPARPIPPKEGCSGDGNGIIIRAHESSPRPRTFRPARRRPLSRHRHNFVLRLTKRLIVYIDTHARTRARMQNGRRGQPYMYYNILLLLWVRADDDEETLRKEEGLLAAVVFFKFTAPPAQTL